MDKHYLTRPVAAESFSYTANYFILPEKQDSGFPDTLGRLRAGLCWRSLILIAPAAPALRILASIVASAFLLEPDLFGVVAPWQLYPGSSP